MIVNFNEKKLETDFEKLGSKQSYQYFYKNQFLETEDKNQFFRNYDTSKQTHSPMDSILQGHTGTAYPPMAASPPPARDQQSIRSTVEGSNE
jgi:hypothetical protein